MPTTIDSAGITFNDATSFTSAVLAANSVGATQITDGSVTAAKLGTNEQKQICKAWVNFNGTLASPIPPRASYNVSSVTKTNTGDYTINFPVGTFADANYVACVSFGDLANNGTACATNIGYSQSTTSIRIRNMNVTTVVPQDGDQNYVVVFGN
jgi:hypothetical protein